MLMILVLKFMVHGALSDRSYLSLGLLSSLNIIMVKVTNVLIKVVIILTSKLVLNTLVLFSVLMTAHGCIFQC